MRQFLLTRLDDHPGSLCPTSSATSWSHSLDLRSDLAARTTFKSASYATRFRYSAASSTGPPINDNGQTLIAAIAAIAAALPRRIGQG
jgi:hypothetical protein